MADPRRPANGLVIAAPRSGSGKTLITLGILGALARRGLAVVPAKTGPDYIDRTILARVAGTEAINLDPWAMTPDRLRTLAGTHSRGADLLLIEGVMGLFDAAADGKGSTADLAETLRLPVILVVDAEKQGQSVAALVQGFARFRPGVVVAGVILNRVSTTRHERLLRDALTPLGIPVLGALPRRDTLVVPERHLGLVLPEEVAGFDAIVDAAATAIGEYVDLNRLLVLSAPLPAVGAPSRSSGGGTGKAGGWEPPALVFPRLPPLGQRIAIARDAAFAFIYPHILHDWHAAGAEISFFSPLADEPAKMGADSVFLPGGYPELHGEVLSEASHFHQSLHAARDRNALIYGECGGYMVLGDELRDAAGIPYKMAGLLPIRTDISRPRRTLGYRRLHHNGALPFPRDLLGHEFHYSAGGNGTTPLFDATDAIGNPMPPMGAVVGRVMGSYAHVIDVA